MTTIEHNENAAMVTPIVYNVPSSAPARKIKTNRSLLKLVLLTPITLCIYRLVFDYSVADDLNVMASRYDGKKTMNFALMSLLGLITFFIADFVWWHRISNRIGSELKRRGIDYHIDASTFWLWNILGILIIVGPFVYAHKLCTAMNKLSEHYNIHG